MATTLLDTFLVEFVFKGDRRELDKLERGIKNINQRLNNLVRPLTIAGTAGAAALGLIGKAGLDTEKALLRTRAELGLTEDQMRMLREEALRVGSTLPLNTADIVNAQRAYGKLGALFGEIIQDTPAIAGAAVATGLQPEQVAQYARIIQNVFGGDVEENLDLMVRLANRGNATFAQLGESLQFSGQSAADAGLDFKTYIAVLGGVAGAGRSVESVAQGLTGIWARLAKANEDIGRGGAIVMESFEGVGISFEDVSAKMDGTAEGFVNVLRLINEAGLSTSQLTALLSTLAGDTYSASISYAVQNPEAIRELLDEAALAPGEIVRQQEIILSGASGGIMQMMAQIDTLLNRLAEFGTLTGIQNFTKGVSVLIGWLTKTNEENELVNKGFLRLISAFVMALASLLVVAAALKVTTFALSGFVVLVKIVRGAVWLWRNAIIMTRIQMGLLSVQTWWANSALRGFATSMLKFARAPVAGMVAGLRAVGLAMWGLVANPVGAAIAAIALAIVAAAVIIRKYWEPIKAFFIGLWEGLQEALQPIKEAFGEVIAALEPLQPVLSAIGDAFGWVGDIIGKVVGWFTKLLDPVDETSRSVKQAGDAGRTTGKIIGTLLLLPIKLIIGYFKLWIMIIRTLINVFTRLRDTVGKVISTIKAVWNWAKGNWPLLVGILLGPFGIVGALIWKFRDQILGAFRDVWGWLRESPIFGPVIDGIQAIIDFVRKLPGRVVGILKDIPGMVADAIRDVPGLGAALEVFTGIAGKVGKALGFAEGGIVPGPLGRPLLATVHGGEMVLPVGASRVIAQMLEGFRLGPAALPQAPHYYGQMYRSSVTNRTVNINMNEPIVIQTQATDAKGIAQELGEAIQDQIRNVAYDHDGPVER